MPNPTLRSIPGVLALLACAAFVGLASADVKVSATPAKNTIRIRWKFPCAGPPPEIGEADTTTTGNPPDEPPADVCLTELLAQSDNFDNRIFAFGCFRADTIATGVLTRGCSQAGWNQIEASTAAPFAAVGLWSTPDAGPPDTPLSARIERTVTPALVPDIVTITFLQGGLQARTVSAGDVANAILKLIVYPDQASADADAAHLTGAGSAFFGQVTLDGASGSLIPLQGFSALDFALQSVGGVLTATPLLGLNKVVLVPDANQAVVTMVADPQSTPETTVGVGDGSPIGLRLSPRPNPFAGGVAFSFNLPQQAPASLELYDLLGRRVRSWRWDGLAAGEHLVRWDGRTDTGARAPAGTLMLRLTAMGTSITEKVVRLP